MGRLFQSALFCEGHKGVCGMIMITKVLLLLTNRADTLKAFVHFSRLLNSYLARIASTCENRKKPLGMVL